jgi:hypothetical protein
LEAACVVAEAAEPYRGRFAGKHVRKELARRLGRPVSFPGLLQLVAYGLLEKAGESSDGGRKAWYRMPERSAVEAAIGAVPRPKG